MTCLPGIAPGVHHCRHARLAIDEYAGLGTEAEEAFAASKGRYGYRGIMAEGDLTAHVPRRRRYDSHEGETTPAPDNLADRDFTAKPPNEKRPADITRDQGRGREGRASRRRSTAKTAGSSRTPPVPAPTPGSPTGCPSRPRRRCRRGAKPLVHSDRGLPLPVARMAGPHGTVRPGAVDGREGPFAGQRRRGGVLRQDEDGIRPSRALGGTYPRRGARLGRRLHPLARPRAHQTVARLDEPGTIPPEPGKGCVIVSKKTPAAPIACPQNKETTAPSFAGRHRMSDGRTNALVKDRYS